MCLLTVVFSVFGEKKSGQDIFCGPIELFLVPASAPRLG